MVVVVVVVLTVLVLINGRLVRFLIDLGELDSFLYTVVDGNNLKITLMPTCQGLLKQIVLTGQYLQN
jgi:hypothetical protein